ncbi:MAG: TldD/PmbA family protein [Bacteriovoracaceae bacterium]|jgi:TldD protein|nr:TldD/PmbA family protein [Bacteriovoracaceae bacterium]
MKNVAIEEVIKEAAHYVELRAQKNTTQMVGLINGDLMSNSETVASGVSARSFINGEWAMAASSVISKDSLWGVLEKSKRNAEFLSKIKSTPANTKIVEKEFQFERDYQGSTQVLTQKDLIDKARDINSYIEKKYPDLKRVDVIINYNELEKKLMASNGSSAYHTLPRTVFYVSLSYEKDGEIVSLLNGLGGYGRTFDVMDGHEKFYPEIEKTYQQVREKASGIMPSAGVKDVIVSPAVTGVLAHEAVGHPAEADLVRAGSVAGVNLGKEVASSLVTMVDFAHSYNGKELPVPVYIDDEGVEAVDSVLIDQGTLVNYMHNRESSSHFDMAPTGNARAFTYTDEPLIRMRNTIILPGQDKLDDMISSIDDGYHLLSRSNGQADLTTEFMFGVTFGYEIKKGKLGRAIKDTTISGVAFNMLKTVDMVSDEFSVHSTGFCGKKQRMIVSHGGPSLKCKVHIGGK